MGLKFDVSKMRKALQDKQREIRADTFKPELKRHAGRTLKTAMQMTPVRSMARITAAQRRQYQHRVDYIPTIHKRSDPGLIVNEQGQHWLRFQGRWYLASKWKLPPQIYAIYYELLTERNRRLQTSLGSFIAERAQARFLYRRSWTQCAASAGIIIQASSQVMQAHSRHNPAKEPPRGYAQWRGGKNVLTLAIFNPLLQQESRYKDFDGKQILARASVDNLPTFYAEVNRKLTTMLMM